MWSCFVLMGDGCPLRCLGGSSYRRYTLPKSRSRLTRIWTRRCQPHRRYSSASPAELPAVRYDYFGTAFNEAELNRRVKTIVAILRVGGWPADLFELKAEGVRKILLGEETAPPAIWRYLCDGLEKALERCEGESPSDLLSPAAKTKHREDLKSKKQKR
jgi:hypothetical protein